MKKIFSLILFVFVAVLCGAVSDAIWEQGGSDSVYSSAHGYDTLKGSDSCQFLNDFVPGPWNYWLVWGELTGDSADDCTLEVLIKVVNRQDSILYQVKKDSINTADYSGGAIDLGIGTGTSIVGTKIDAYLKAVGTTTNDTIQINELELRKMRPLQYNYDKRDADLRR